MTDRQRFIGVKFFLFMILIIVSDYTIGHMLDYLYFNASTGKYYKLNYVISKSREDILIFGSSHAECHYIPRIFEDSLHLDCFNAGFRNQGILFAYAIHQSILRRYSPRLVIFNFDKDMLYANTAAFENEKSKLSELLPFCKKERNIKEVIESRSIYEKYKLFSGIYPFNSDIVYLLKYNLSHSDNFNDGYYPVYGNYNPPIGDFEKTNSVSLNPEHINSELSGKLIEMFKHFRDQNTNIVAVVSPTFNSSENIDTLLAAFFTRQEIPLLDYSDDPYFRHKASFFTDGHHLNDSGARLFSAIVAHDIKIIFKK
jgi:hypothetical protein